jgi:hypothetical protein
MQSSANALRLLPTSTVCGITSLNSVDNPTCQPTKFIATWTGAGITFKWLPGCRAAEKYQLLREGTDQIGQDFEKQETSATTAVTADTKNK